MPARKKDTVQKTKNNNGEILSGTATSNLPASAKNETAGNEKYEEKNFVDTTKPVWNYSLLTDDEVSNYQQGTHQAKFFRDGWKYKVCVAHFEET